MKAMINVWLEATSICDLKCESFNVFERILKDIPNSQSRIDRKKSLGRIHAALVLRFIHGKTYKEIGNEFGVTRDRARQIVERGIRSLIWHNEFSSTLAMDLDQLLYPSFRAGKIGYIPFKWSSYEEVNQKEDT